VHMSAEVSEIGAPKTWGEFVEFKRTIAQGTDIDRLREQNPRLVHGVLAHFSSQEKGIRRQSQDALPEDMAHQVRRLCTALGIPCEEPPQPKSEAKGFGHHAKNFANRMLQMAQVW